MNKSMNKIFIILILLLFTAQALSAETPRSELDKSVYEIINNYKEEVNRFVGEEGIPPGLGMFASARINLNVDSEKVGIIIQNGRITDVVKGGIDNPTTEIWTTKDFIMDVSTSGDPRGLIVAGLNTGELRKKDYGAANILKGAATSYLLKVANIISPPKETRERVSGDIKAVGISPVEGSYVINPATSNLRRSHIEIKSKEGKDVGGEGVKIIEYAALKEGKAPMGLKKWEVAEGEVSLGTFVNLEAPATEVDWTTIIIKYSEKELGERGLTEDSLYMKWYDDDPDSETYGEWVTLIDGNPSWVNSIRIDKENNVVWVKTSHLSVYGIGGSVYGVSGSVYGVSGTVLGPPPEPIQVQPPVTLAPIEPIKEPERPILPLVALVLVIIAPFAIIVVLIVKRKAILNRLKKKTEEEGEGAEVKIEVIDEE
ncbi:MAG: hypothetical protein V3T58_00440 [Candidatus Hydrothermarchaeales archaeon]